MRPSARSILRVSPSRSNLRTPPSAASGVNREIQAPSASSGASPSVSTGTSTPDSFSDCPSASSRRSPGPPRGPQPPTTSNAPSPTSPRSKLETASSSEPKTRHSPAGSVTPLRTRQMASAPDALAVMKTKRERSPGAGGADGRFSFRLPATVGTSWSASPREERRPATPYSRNHSGSAWGVSEARTSIIWPNPPTPASRAIAARWTRTSGPPPAAMPARSALAREKSSTSLRGRGPSTSGSETAMFAGAPRPGARPRAIKQAQRGDEHSSERLGACGTEQETVEVHAGAGDLYQVSEPFAGQRNTAFGYRGL